MATIKFTDSDGEWLLHNAKPYPADRFANWTPDTVPVGDTAVRLSDGAMTQFRQRTDYGASFELPYIPSKRCNNLVLQPENFGTTWIAVGTPTRTAQAHDASGIVLDLIGDDSGAAIEYYRQTISFTGDGVKAISAFVRRGTIQAATGSLINLSDNTAVADRLRAAITFTGDGVPSVATSAGTYLGYEQYCHGVFRVMFASTSVTAANTNDINIGGASTSAEQGNFYVGGVQAENQATPTSYLHTTTAARTGVALCEIADRLKWHLLNGGSCTVYPADAWNSPFTTLGLKPGTAPQVTLSDRRSIEYTFSAQLINLAGSPSRLTVYYADL